MFFFAIKPTTQCLKSGGCCGALLGEGVALKNHLCLDDHSWHAHTHTQEECEVGIESKDLLLGMWRLFLEVGNGTGTTGQWRTYSWTFRKSHLSSHSVKPSTLLLTPFIPTRRWLAWRGLIVVVNSLHDKLPSTNCVDSMLYVQLVLTSSGWGTDGKSIGGLWEEECEFFFGSLIGMVSNGESQRWCFMLVDYWSSKRQCFEISWPGWIYLGPLTTTTADKFVASTTKITYIVERISSILSIYQSRCWNLENIWLTMHEHLGLLF